MNESPGAGRAAPRLRSAPGAVRGAGAAAPEQTKAGIADRAGGVSVLRAMPSPHSPRPRVVYGPPQHGRLCPSPRGSSLHTPLFEPLGGAPMPLPAGKSPPVCPPKQGVMPPPLGLLREEGSVPEEA